MAARSQSFTFMAPTGRRYTGTFDPGLAKVWFCPEGEKGADGVALWLTAMGAWVLHDPHQRSGESMWRRIEDEEANEWLLTRGFDVPVLVGSDRLRLGVPLATELTSMADKIGVDVQTAARMAIEAFVGREVSLSNIRTRWGVLRDIGRFRFEGWAAYVKRDDEEYEEVTGWDTVKGDESLLDVRTLSGAVMRRPVYTRILGVRVVSLS